MTKQRVTLSDGSQVIRRRGVTVGPNDATSRLWVKADGQGNVVYGGTGVAVGLNARRGIGYTSGTASYTPSSGYSGQNKTVVNGQVYTTVTQDGSKTLTNPGGEVSVYTRPRYR